MHNKEILFNYLLRIADSALIHGHRLSEWCGHGPVLEQDIALTNIALDQIGQAKSLLEYAAEVEGQGRSADDLAYLRDVREFKNILLVELPNVDFAQTMVKMFLYDQFSYLLFKDLQGSSDSQLAAIAEKSLKEVSYHKRYSSEWMIRLGDGTEESHKKMQNALNEMWMYSGELFEADDIEKEAKQSGFGADIEQIQSHWETGVKNILDRATLQTPSGKWMQKGGKHGLHTEHLGFILAEMQFLQRAYPGAKW